MLEKNDSVYTVKERDVTAKKLFNFFFEMDCNIIYVVDGEDKFIGIITNKEFLTSLKEKEEICINKHCAVINLETCMDTFAEAGRLFYKYHINTAIPVVNKTGRICYEIRKKRTVKDSEVLQNFWAKFSKYEHSMYLNYEVECLKKMLENQTIIVIGTEERFEYIFKERVFGTKKKIVFKKEFKDAYEFLCDSMGLIIDVSISTCSARKTIYAFCNNGYGWDVFLDKIIYAIENEHCSRFYRVTDNQIVTVKDWLRKYSDGKMFFSTEGIFTSALREYLNKYQFDVIEQKGICRGASFRFHLCANGIVSRNCIWNEFNVLVWTDIILQFYYLNQELKGQNLVLNFVFDQEAKFTAAECERVKDGNWKNWDLKKYISVIEEGKTDNLLYCEKNRRLDYLVELEKSLNFRHIRNFENNRIVFKDCTSKLINIQNGIRKTCHQPEKYAGTVFFLGLCTMYGAKVEDSMTIPSIIQKIINESGRKYRTVNLGIGTSENYVRLKKSLNFGKEDIFVLFFPFITEEIKKYVPVIEVGETFNQIRAGEFCNKECFMDTVLHCADNGNLIYSDIIYNELKKYLNYKDGVCLKANNIYDIFKKDETDLDVFYDWDIYKAELQQIKKIMKNDDKAGCIVMNCNPFTLGHRYLIEYALKKVKYLYVFMVEEDKSYFSFADRCRMVKAGIGDLENVSVIRSGKCVVSAETFPAYFEKENVERGAPVSVSEDLRIFAQYIAAVLDIQCRFVGEEPEDYVTGRYNIEMKKILPQFGIDVIEVPRKIINGTIVSAAMVRKYYHKKDFTKVKEYVPKAVADYLMRLSNIM